MSQHLILRESGSVSILQVSRQAPKGQVADLGTQLVRGRPGTPVRPAACALCPVPFTEPPFLPRITGSPCWRGLLSDPSQTRRSSRWAAPPASCSLSQPQAWYTSMFCVLSKATLSPAASCNHLCARRSCFVVLTGPLPCGRPAAVPGGLPVPPLPSGLASLLLCGALCRPGAASSDGDRATCVSRSNRERERRR